MCGIVGYIGGQNAIPVLIHGLKSLEYRGYDSAGIAYLKENTIIVTKNIGKVSSLENLISQNEKSNLGIAHTRWATHGGVTKENAHPHKVGSITLVHNGIIENYASLKNMLIKEGYNFKSETDTEILAGLIDFLYHKDNNLLNALHEISEYIKGSYALLVINDDEKDKVYATRYNSPLIAAKDENGIYFASDVPAILEYTSAYYLLENGDIAVASDKLSFYDDKCMPIIKEEKIYEGTKESAMKGDYEHFMLKEINEEPGVVKNILNHYVENNNFNSNMPEFKKYQKIYIVGCGSAYYTGEVVKLLYEKYLDIPVTTYLASEYRYQKIFYDQDTLVIFISQSGETADTLEALRKTKNDGIDTLAIVNAYESSIAREADTTLYIKAGIEVSVATTKAFTAQLTLLMLILIKMTGKIEFLKYFISLPNALDKILEIDYNTYAKKIYKCKDAFYIGRLLDYGLCEEGSLKLKEICYINSSAYASGELKHGTISLIEKGTPVIGIVSSEDVRLKTISNLKEVKAREAYVLYITNNEEDGDFYNDRIIIPFIHEIVNPILMVMPLQLLAYHTAYLKGLDIDKPRNLAKSVTVE